MANRRFLLFFCFCIAFLEQVFAEVDKGLGCLGNVAVFLPSQTNIDNERVSERNSLDTGRIFDYHVEKEGDANTAGDQSL